MFALGFTATVALFANLAILLYGVYMTITQGVGEYYISVFGKYYVFPIFNILAIIDVSSGMSRRSPTPIVTPKSRRKQDDYLDI